MKKSNKQQPLVKWKGKQSNTRTKAANGNILTAGNNSSNVDKNILAFIDALLPEEKMQINKSQENPNTSAKDHQEEVVENEEKENNWANQPAHPAVLKKVHFMEELGTESPLSEEPKAADAINREMQMLDGLAPPVPPVVSDVLEKQFLLGPGDVVWAYIPGWPLWPGIISTNKDEGVHLKSKGCVISNYCIQDDYF